VASPADWFKRLLFELGAGYYARKLADGPEANLRREFADWIAPSPGARVLDVGCGPGHVARLLARRGCSVIGVDPGWRLLRIARRLATREGLSIRFERAAGERLPFATGAFDLTLATTVIYWVARPEAVLCEMARVTRAGGVVATLDAHASMTVASMRAYCENMRFTRADTRKLMAWARASKHCRRFTEEELRSLLYGAGLAEQHCERRLAGLVWFVRGVVPQKP